MLRLVLQRGPAPAYRRIIWLLLCLRSTASGPDQNGRAQVDQLAPRPERNDQRQLQDRPTPLSLVIALHNESQVHLPCAGLASTSNGSAPVQQLSVHLLYDEVADQPVLHNFAEDALEHSAADGDWLNLTSVRTRLNQSNLLECRLTAANVSRMQRWRLLVLSASDERLLRSPGGQEFVMINANPASLLAPFNASLRLHWFALVQPTVYGARRLTCANAFILRPGRQVGFTEYWSPAERRRLAGLEFDLLQQQFWIDQIRPVDSGFLSCEYESRRKRVRLGTWIEVHPERPWMTFQSDYSMQRPLLAVPNRQVKIAIRVNFERPGPVRSGWTHNLAELREQRTTPVQLTMRSLYFWIGVRSAGWQSAGIYTLVLNQTLSEWPYSLFVTRSVGFQLAGATDLRRFHRPEFYRGQQFTLICRADHSESQQLGWMRADCLGGNCDEALAKWVPLESSDLVVNASANQERLFTAILDRFFGVVLLSFTFVEPMLYRCFARRPGMTSHQTIAVQQKSAPVRMHVVRPAAFVGETLQLRCEGELDQPQELIWRHAVHNVSTLENSTLHRIEQQTREEYIRAFLLILTKEYLDFVPHRTVQRVNSTLTIGNLKADQAGRYTCGSSELSADQDQYFLRLRAPTKVRVVSLHKQLLDGRMRLICRFEGEPEPEPSWTLNGLPYNGTTERTTNMSRLLLSSDEPVDAGLLVGCLLDNGLAQDAMSLQLSEMPEEQPPSRWLQVTLVIAGSCVLSLACCLVGGWYSRRMHRKRMLAAKQGYAFYNTEEYLELVEQLTQGSLLEGSDSSGLEFPADRLELGELLGKGAFGLVVKASAVGIEKGGGIQTVAVKMARDQQDEDQLKALVSEAKMLAYLGRQLNVASLLGVVSRGSRLLVIVEYCELGCLKDYLTRQRANFVSLLDSESGEFFEELELGGCQTPDSGVEHELDTFDLLHFAFQIARGMQYVHSKRLLHCDLAARNLLLTADKVVKICDFGLSKDIFVDDLYVKQGDGRLPMRWMAIESLVERRFSTKSDVWSFAVVCWELFTLGATPYPGVKQDENVSAMLTDGYRMERPDYCPVQVYQVMADCWQLSPEARPEFAEIVARVEQLIVQCEGNAYVGLLDHETSA